MPMNARRLSALLLTAGLTAFTLPAVAQSRQALAQSAPTTPQSLHRPLARLRDCLGILNLSEAQKADIKAVLDAAKPQFDTLAATLQADREALSADLSKTPPDPCAIGNDVLKLHADREAMRAFLGSVKDEILALLTDAQKAKLVGCLEAPRAALAAPLSQAAPVE